uniref:RB_A domain-containing protein n=1 Tax=Gongylonema pulchrum TaxID=637853 RepID=A0A183DNK8_9BILA
LRLLDVYGKNFTPTALLKIQLCTFGHKTAFLQTLCSLTCAYFAAGRIKETRGILNEIKRNWPKYKKGLENKATPVVTQMNEETLAGYFDALGITHSIRAPSPGVRKEDLIYKNITEETLEVLDDCSMVSRWECHRIATTSAAALADDILAKNLISECCAGIPASPDALSKLMADDSALPRFVKIKRNWPRYKKGLENKATPIVTQVNEKTLAGYFDALGISHPVRAPSPHVRKEDLIYKNITEETLEVLDDCSMVSRWECHRIATTSAAALADDVLAKNLISECCAGIPASPGALSKLMADESALPRFVKICSHFVKKGTNKEVVREVMQFFCTKMPKFAEELRKACPDIGEEYFGKWEEIPENEVVAVPSPSEINGNLPADSFVQFLTCILYHKAL